MSLRSTAAVGAATLVAGATFAVSAFADDGLDPDLAASAAVPGTEEPATDTESEGDSGSEENEDFFSSSEQVSEDELQNRREQAQEQRESARGNSVVSTSATGSAIQEEEEEEEEEVPEEFEGDPKGIALQMVLDEGWGAEEFNGCLEPLWEKESNWNHTAQNASSGAYGIPQSLPGSKMATHGDDWQTNPATQIAWGIDYIKGRYGTPCEAWAHSQSIGWY